MRDFDTGPRKDGVDQWLKRRREAGHPLHSSKKGGCQIPGQDVRMTGRIILRLVACRSKFSSLGDVERAPRKIASRFKQSSFNSEVLTGEAILLRACCRGRRRMQIKEVVG